MRERGAWVSAVGSACGQSCDRPVARLHAPRKLPSFPTWTFGEFGGRTGGPCRRSPGPWLPVPASVPRVRTIPKILDPSGSKPGGNACEVRFASQARSFLPARDWLPPAGTAWSPRPRTPRRPPPFHPEASVDLETSLRKGACSIRRLEGVGDNFPISGAQIPASALSGRRIFFPGLRKNRWG